MGVVYKRGAWWIDYRHNGHRYRRRVGHSKTLAENALRKVKLEIAENKFLDIKRNKKVPFYELCDLYIERHAKVHKRHWQKADKHHIKRLKEYFGNPDIHAITQEKIDQYVSKRIKEVSPATVNREMSCIKHMFNKAIEWGKINDNPARRIKKLKENNRRTRFLEKHEIKKLIDNCSEYLKPIIVTAINTGMRKGEILGLKWKDIDVQRGIIYLIHTKNGECREIPMNNIVKQTFIKIPKHKGTEYIFCNRKGKPYKSICTTFFTSLRKADIINFRFHDLRHTFASHLMMSGADLNTVRELLGHKSIEMTLRYSHLSPHHKKHAVDVLERQMDSIWTPKQLTDKVTEEGVLVTHSIVSR